MLSGNNMYIFVLLYIAIYVFYLLTIKKQYKCKFCLATISQLLACILLVYWLFISTHLCFILNNHILDPLIQLQIPKLNNSLTRY